MKLNLGCGNDVGNGFVCLDKQAKAGVDYVLDLERERLPFEDNSVDYIKANHFLEHIFDPRHLLNECWRVLKPSGVFHSKSPFGYYEGYPKPVHRQLIAESWFDFLRKESCKDEGYEMWDLKVLERVNGGAEIVCDMSPVK